MLTQSSKRKEGFTIIEVLIVLAIAGLILLVVFLAVPALQRNADNTQRKSDVSASLSAVTEWSNNNGGKLPTTAAEQTEAASNVKLGFYASIAWAAGAQTNNGNVDSLTIVTGAKCSGDDTVAGSSRQFAALYTVQTGGSPDKVCQES